MYFCGPNLNKSNAERKKEVYNLTYRESSRPFGGLLSQTK